MTAITNVDLNQDILSFVPKQKRVKLTMDMLSMEN